MPINCVTHSCKFIKRHNDILELLVNFYKRIEKIVVYYMYTIKMLALSFALRVCCISITVESLAWVRDNGAVVVEV